MPRWTTVAQGREGVEEGRWGLKVKYAAVDIERKRWKRPKQARARSLAQPGPASLLTRLLGWIRWIGLGIGRPLTLLRSAQLVHTSSTVHCLYPSSPSLASRPSLLALKLGKVELRQ